MDLPLHGEPAVVVAGPHVDDLGVIGGTGIDMERVQIEGRAHGRVAELAQPCLWVLAAQTSEDGFLYALFSLVLVAMAMGVKRRPSNPSKAISGVKTSMISSVAYRMEPRTSLEAEAMIESGSGLQPDF